MFSWNYKRSPRSKISPNKAAEFLVMPDHLMIALGLGGCIGLQLQLPALSKCGSLSATRTSDFCRARETAQLFAKALRKVWGWAEDGWWCFFCGWQFLQLQLEAPNAVRVKTVSTYPILDASHVGLLVSHMYFDESHFVLLFQTYSLILCVRLLQLETRRAVFFSRCFVQAGRVCPLRIAKELRERPEDYSYHNPGESHWHGTFWYI